MTVPKQIEELLEDLAESLQIPPSRYEAAERSYKSVGDWLHREASSLRQADPQVYIQGSFRLGTTIRPISEAEHYDVDLVCELSVSKTRLTQAQLKAAFGRELAVYAEAHNLDEPEEGRRCWTLNYADSAQFHLDTLAAVPDATRKRLLLEEHGLSTQWTETAVAITDREHPRFGQLTEDWPHSNPKGYSEWFRSRMVTVFNARRQRLAMEARASVEDIPEYKVRTPLQHAIQILKRHRDMMFDDRTDEKPISIILTTLAAHAYRQETTIAAALYSMLQRMDTFIEDRGGVAWIANPTDPAENFADKWQQHPERKDAFYEWLEQARTDFRGAAEALSRDSALAVLEPRIGRRLVEVAQARRKSARQGAVKRLASSVKSAVGIFLNPDHRQPPPWNPVTQGDVQIERAIVERKGYRPQEFSSDGPAQPKRAKLGFEADTNVPKPYKVYWQVVNTEQEAEGARGLRGRFDERIVTPGKLTRKESTLYTGKHSIECFVVKNDLLAACSGQFIVNIQ
jgi:hypothetical protein